MLLDLLAHVTCTLQALKKAVSCVCNPRRSTHCLSLHLFSGWIIMSSWLSGSSCGTIVLGSCFL